MREMERYRNIFIKIFDVDEQILQNNFKYQSHPNWDSLGHMTLVAAIESEFGINMDMDDVIDLESYEKGIEILAKYNIIIT
jgi:acyl carrier protein